MSRSEFVCGRCGCAVYLWRSGWKHAAGSRVKSCGRPPMVASRAEFEEAHERDAEALRELFSKM